MISTYKSLAKYGLNEAYEKYSKPVADLKKERVGVEARHAYTILMSTLLPKDCLQGVECLKRLKNNKTAAMVLCSLDKLSKDLRYAAYLDIVGFETPA